MRGTKVNQFYFIAFLLFLNLCTLRSNAQYYSSSPTFFGGFTAGANFAQVDGDNFAGYKKLGLNAGALVHTAIGENFTISMELLYSQKGSHAGKSQLPKQTISGYLIKDYNINIVSADIPFSLNYFFKDNKSIVSAGLGYAHLVYASSFVNGVATIKDYPFKKSDISLNIGASYRLHKRYFLNVRFQNSVLNIRKIHDPLTERSEQFNRLLSLRLMYLFWDGNE